MLKQSEFADWIKNPITQAAFKVIEERKDYYSESILDGAPGGTEVLLTLGEHIGRVNAYNELLGITFDDFDVEEIEEASNASA
jgi:hypothetical protein